MFIRIAIAVAAVSFATPLVARAQSAPEATRWEFRVSSGALVPTGARQADLTHGNFTAAQLSYAVAPRVVVVGTAGWGRARGTAIGAPKLDVFSYDIGTEIGPARRQSGRRLTFRPFAAAGAGGRSYNYRNLPVDATHDLSVYAGIGGEIGIRRVHLRIEARDYVGAFTPLDDEGPAATRHEVVVLTGVRFGL
jgi:hypothetical protein